MVREIDEDILEIRQFADKAEASERRAAEETERANDLARQLDEERRKSAGIADEFARFRLAAERRTRRRSAPWRCNRRTPLRSSCCGARSR